MINNARTFVQGYATPKKDSFLNFIFYLEVA